MESFALHSGLAAKSISSVFARLPGPKSKPHNRLIWKARRRLREVASSARISAGRAYRHVWVQNRVHTDLVEALELDNLIGQAAVGARPRGLPVA
jgi:hypothetical protein